MAKNKITPAVLVNAIRENQNNNKTLKALFANQFFGKFEISELEALKQAIDKEIAKREDQVIQEKIEFLKEHGYSVERS